MQPFAEDSLRSRAPYLNHDGFTGGVFGSQKAAYVVRVASVDLIQTETAP